MLLLWCFKGANTRGGIAKAGAFAISLRQGKEMAFSQSPNERDAIAQGEAVGEVA